MENNIIIQQMINDVKDLLKDELKKNLKKKQQIFETLNDIEILTQAQKNIIDYLTHTQSNT